MNKTELARLERAYHAQWRRSQRRGIGWHISWPEWLAWWQATGRLDQRGQGPDLYVMARRDMTEDYTMDNIECITQREACQRYWQSGRRPQAVSHNQRIAAERCRAVATPQGQFPSLQSAAAAHGCSISRIHWRLKHWPDRYRYLS